MEKLPASAGWSWIKDGFALFRKQPLEIFTLFLAYVFFMLALGLVPLAGSFLTLLLTPVLSMAFMQACVQAEQGKRIYPNLLLTGFRSPAFSTLMALGVVYLLAAAAAIGAASLADGGTLWKVMSGQIKLEPDIMEKTRLPLGMLVAGAVYTPAAMAFWYAPMLAAWQGMPTGKSMFYSFFAVKKLIKPFLVYGLAWAGIGMFVPSTLSTIVMMIAGPAAAMMLVLVPLSVLLPLLVYCSIYPSYVTVFGRPHDDKS